MVIAACRDRQTASGGAARVLGFDTEPRKTNRRAMNQIAGNFPTPFAIWSRRLALFSGQLVLLGIVLHRFASLPTPVAINVFAASFVGAGVAVLLSFVAFVLIWRQGRSGAWSAFAGLVFGLLLFAWPAAYVPTVLALPPIHDVTTDPVSPPQFVALAKQRPTAANSAAYGGAEVAKQQAEAYPDIRPFVLPRSVTETYEIVGEVARRLRWKVANEVAPQGKGRPGYIEAVDRTLVVGFADDVVIRIDGDQREARIDVRSASRFGQHDLGRNATRVRLLFREIEQHMERSAAGDRSLQRRKSRLKAVPKRPKGSPALSAAQLKSQGRAQQGAQRVPPPKEKQRPPTVNQGLGIQFPLWPQ